MASAIAAYAFKWVVFDKHLDLPVAGFILRAEAMVYVGDSQSYEVREAF